MQIEGVLPEMFRRNTRERGMDSMDYYYRDRMTDFVFIKKDSAYTPTYATIESHYFNNERRDKNVLYELWE